MTFRHEAEVSVADWLVQSPIPWYQLVGFGPAGFDAYARLRFIPDPVREGQSESDQALAEDHPREHEQSRRALDILRGFTTTPDHCYFCVWEGTGYELPASIFRSPSLEVPHRRYFLARGGCADFESWEAIFEHGAAPLPAFIWPADHAWCFARDVDPHWAGIGGSRSAIGALIDSVLDVVPAQPHDSQPAYL